MITFTKNHSALVLGFVLFLLQFCLLDGHYPAPVMIALESSRAESVLPDFMFNNKINSINSSLGYGAHCRDIVPDLKLSHAKDSDIEKYLTVGFFEYISYRLEMSLKLFWFVYCLCAVFSAYLTSGICSRNINSFRKIPVPGYFLHCLPLSLVFFELLFLLIEKSFPSLITLSAGFCLLCCILSAELTAFLYSSVNPDSGRITNT